MKNSHNLTGLLAESLVWLLLLVKDCWKSCFVEQTPTLYVFFRHHLRQDPNTYNARVLANVSKFFHHLVLQVGVWVLVVARGHIQATIGALSRGNDGDVGAAFALGLPSFAVREFALWVAGPVAYRAAPVGFRAFILSRRSSRV